MLRTALVATCGGEVAAESDNRSDTEKKMIAHLQQKKNMFFGKPLASSQKKKRSALSHLGNMCVKKKGGFGGGAKPRCVESTTLVT